MIFTNQTLSSTVYAIGTHGAAGRLRTGEETTGREFVRTTKSRRKRQSGEEVSETENFVTKIHL